MLLATGLARPPHLVRDVLDLARSRGDARLCRPRDRGPPPRHNHTRRQSLPHWAYYCPGKRSESHRVIFVGEHRRDFDALFEVAAPCSEVEPGDSQGMVRTVLDLIGDRSRRERMGLASRRRALSFDWARVAERQLDVYRQALPQRRAGRASARRSGIRSALKRAYALRELVLGCLAGETPCRRPPAPGGP